MTSCHENFAQNFSSGLFFLRSNSNKPWFLISFSILSFLLFFLLVWINLSTAVIDLPGEVLAHQTFPFQRFASRISRQTCATTLSSSESLLTLGNYNTSIFIPIRCPGFCSLYGNKLGAVTGSQTYSTSSPVCRAAIHAGVTSGLLGGCVFVRYAGPQKTFSSSYSNGVLSRASGLAAFNSFEVRAPAESSGCEDWGWIGIFPLVLFLICLCAFCHPPIWFFFAYTIGFGCLYVSLVSMPLIPAQMEPDFHDASVVDKVQNSWLVGRVLRRVPLLFVFFFTLWQVARCTLPQNRFGSPTPEYTQVASASSDVDNAIEMQSQCASRQEVHLEAGSCAPAEPQPLLDDPVPWWELILSYTIPFFAGLHLHVLGMFLPTIVLSSGLFSRPYAEQGVWGLTVTILLVVVIPVVLVAVQIRVCVRGGKAWYLIVGYSLFGLVFLLVSLGMAAHFDVHIHHALWALVLLPFTLFRTRSSRIIQSFLFGVFANGVVFYRFSSFWEPRAIQLRLWKDVLPAATLAAPSVVARGTDFLTFAFNLTSTANLPAWQYMTVFVAGIEAYRGLAVENFTINGLLGNATYAVQWGVVYDSLFMRSLLMMPNNGYTSASINASTL